MAYLSALGPKARAGVAAALLSVPSLLPVGVSPVLAQTIWGTVLDSSNGRGVAMAAVYLSNQGREHVSVAMADSLGRYRLSVPASGEYIIVAQRFGYEDMYSPLLEVSGQREYPIDLELRPEPLGLGGITVTVENDKVVEWLTLEMGVSPKEAFGFRLLQGNRLAEAKAMAGNNPTGTLRWLYVPVQHGGSCVSINSVPRPVRAGWGGPRSPVAPPGAVPQGTRAPAENGSQTSEVSPDCGSLFLNDRRIPNEHVDQIDISDVTVIVTLPGTVRMYTYDFEGGFRRR